MAAKRGMYEWALSEYMEYTGMRRNDARSDPYFKDAYQRLKEHFHDENKKQGSPLSDAMVDLGMRDEDDWWDVGDTPGASRKK